jgi:hypothetical protein
MTSTGEFESEQSDTNKRHQTNWHQKNKTMSPKREKRNTAKQQTKTTKHTIEFSNNTPT